jgi:hypothetical protein
MSDQPTKRLASGLAIPRLTSIVLLGLVLLGLVGAPEAAYAQAASGPTLLVLGTVSQDSDPSVAGTATSAIQGVARELGYTIVALDPSAPRASIDLHTGDALSGFTMQTGIDRTLHLHVVRDGVGYALHLAVGSRDGSAAVSLLRAAPLAEIGTALADMTRVLLPLPGVALSGTWIAPPDAAVPTSVPAAPSTTTTTGTSASAFAPPPAPTEPERPRRDRTWLALTVAGAAVLGVGWVTNFIVGIFAGNDGCGFAGCSPESQRWAPFRGVSFIPVLGPWIQFAVLPDANNWWPIWLAFDGLVQAAGFAMLVYGLVTNPGDEPADPATPTVSLLPSFGADYARLDLIGTF